MGIKIIRSPKGKFAKDIKVDFTRQKYVDITFAKRGRLGKILSFKTIKRIKVPKNMSVNSVENHKPKIGSVKIVFKKVPKKFRI